MRKPLPPTPTTALLLAVIGVLSFLVVARFDAGPSAAWAQGGQTTDPPFNAAEQRKMMIQALEKLNTRLSAIENKINTGLTVKVTEMPPVVIKENANAPKK
jgi:hypothetical protein